MSVNQRASKRRWLWLIPVGLLMAVLVGFFVWWQNFTTTPGYSLALLVDAAQQNDRAAFDRLVAVDRVIDNFISQGGQDSSLGVPASLVTSLRTQLQSMAPEAMATVREAVREEIRNRIIELSGSTRSRPFLVTALAIPFKAEINQNGAIAQVKIDQVELVMESLEGSDWKVTSLRDEELAGRVVKGIVKDLPRLGSSLDQQIQKLPETLQKLPLLNDK